MYQETNGGNATKKQDLLLFFGLLALVILARMLMNAVSSIPHGSILQIPLFIGRSACQSEGAFWREKCDVQQLQNGVHLRFNGAERKRKSV